MRWFRLGRGKQQVQHDPGRQQALLEEVRRQYGVQVQVPFGEQAAAVARVLEGDDGLAVAAEIVREFTDAAQAELAGQARMLPRHTRVDRRNYRPLWQEAGAELRWSLFTLPCGLHPYVQVAAAVIVIGDRAKRVVRVTDPEPLLARLFEVLDLTIAGWEYGHVLVDADGAGLAQRLITTTRAVRDAMDEPPPLPPPVRELMRRNHTVDVLDAAVHRVIGGFNPGKTMREQLLA